LKPYSICAIIEEIFRRSRGQITYKNISPYWVWVGDIYTMVEIIKPTIVRDHKAGPCAQDSVVVGTTHVIEDTLCKVNAFN
jgi:hypothetical protein